jgi:hypothetical protein
MFPPLMRSRIETNVSKLEEYLRYLGGLKYKNETTIQAEKDLTETCKLLHDILRFDTFGNGQGPVG